MRLVTLNLWGERGPLADRWPVVERGLEALDADVIALQEVREIPGKVPHQAEALAKRLGRHATFAPAMEWGGGIEGVALLTRGAPDDVQIEALPHGADELRRVALSARIGGVRVATTHLHYRLEDGIVREQQVMALEAFVRRGGEALAFVLGDLNATPDSDEIRWLGGKTTLGGRRTFFQDAWDVLHPDEPGHTWARGNSFTGQMRWLRPGRRIDYVFGPPERRDGCGQVLSSSLALTEPGETGAFASDHYAVVADFRIEPAPPD